MAEKNMLLGQIEEIRRNEILIKTNVPVWLRNIFKNKCIVWCGGKPWQGNFYTVRLRRDTSDEHERKVYDKCIE